MTQSRGRAAPANPGQSPAASQPASAPQTQAAPKVAAPATPSPPSGTQPTPDAKPSREIVIDKAPYFVGETEIKRLAVGSLTFFDFAECARLADLARIRDREDADQVRRYFRREQMIKTVKAFDAGGREVKLDVDDLLGLPRVYVPMIWALIDAMPEPIGSVLSPEETDGITRPIHIRLGTPMKMTSKEDGDKEFWELEFQAPTYGDVEEVMSTDSPAQRTLALLRTCSTPVGSTMMQRPTDTMIRQITFTDGAMIMEQVLPRFL